MGMKRLKQILRRTARRLRGPAPVNDRHLGDERRSAGDWAMAVRHYRAHVTKHPTDFDIWVQLGHGYKETGRLAEAEAAYAAAGRLNASDSDLLLCRGHLAKSMDDAVTAADFYARSFAIDGNPAAARELGQFSAVGEVPPPNDILRLTGGIDGFADGLLAGWAIDARQPDTPAEIEILLDGRVIATGAGDIRRSDIPAAGLGRGEVGFLIDLSGLLDLSKPSELHARIAGSEAELAGSPITVEVADDHRAWSTRWEPRSSKTTRAFAELARETAPAATLSLVIAVEDGALSTDLIESLQRQWCDRWEALLVPTGGRALKLSRSQERRITEDARFRILSAGDGGLAGSLSRAVAESSGDHVVLLPGDSVLEPEAVWRTLDASSRDADLIYWDEARIGRSVEGIERFVFRPLLSRDHVDAFPGLIGSLAVKRGVMLKALSGGSSADLETMDDVRRACVACARAVAHVPNMLERRREQTPQDREPAFSLAPGRSTRDAKDRTLVVIALGSELNTLRPTVQAVLASTTRADTDLVIVSPATRSKTTERYLDRLAGAAAVQTCEDDCPVAVAVNDAVEKYGTGHDNLVFIHAPVTPSAGWLSPLLDLIKRPSAGVAAPVLVSPDGSVLSAGVSVTPSSLAHSHRGVPLRTSRGRSLGWNRSLVSLREQSAAYGCLAVRASTFADAGGLDPAVADGLAFADLCLRLGHTGRRTLIEPRVVMKSFWHEPSSQLDAAFRARWAGLIGEGDPFLHPALTDRLALVALHGRFIPARIRVIDPPLLAACLGRFPLLGAISPNGSGAL